MADRDEPDRENDRPHTLADVVADLPNVCQWVALEVASVGPQFFHQREAVLPGADWQRGSTVTVTGSGEDADVTVSCPIDAPDPFDKAATVTVADVRISTVVDAELGSPGSTAFEYAGIEGVLNDLTRVLRIPLDDGLQLTVWSPGSDYFAIEEDYELGMVPLASALIDSWVQKRYPRLGDDARLLNGVQVCTGLPSSAWPEYLSRIPDVRMQLQSGPSTIGGLAEGWSADAFVYVDVAASTGCVVRVVDPEGSRLADAELTVMQFLSAEDATAVLSNLARIGDCPTAQPGSDVPKTCGPDTAGSRAITSGPWLIEASASGIPDAEEVDTVAEELDELLSTAVDWVESRTFAPLEDVADPRFDYSIEVAPPSCAEGEPLASVRSRSLEVTSCWNRQGQLTVYEGTIAGKPFASEPGPNSERCRVLPEGTLAIEGDRPGWICMDDIAIWTRVGGDWTGPPQVLQREYLDAAWAGGATGD